MKVTKIDVKTQIIDVPEFQDRLRVAKYKSQIVKTGESNLPVSVDEDIYLLRKVYTSTHTHGEPEFYFIHQDQTGLVENLFQINVDLMREKDQKIYKEAYSEGRRRGRVEGKTEAHKAIRLLSWWDRLTKKF
jgi:hypothetical protein